MKKIIFVFIPLVILTCVKQTKAQDQYTASNGITYRLGDVVKVGYGSGYDGSFQFVYWGEAVMGNPIGRVSFRRATLKEIKSTAPSFKNRLETIFVLKGDDLATYSVQIERAIYSCEVEPCSPSESVGRIPRGDDRRPPIIPITVTDELAKLKQLRNRNAIDVFEYNEQKEKMFKNGPPPFSVADEIAKLKSLLDSGAIDVFDYGDQKKKLLGW